MLNHAMAIVQRTALHRSISKRRDLLPRSASKEMPTSILCPRRITARVVAADHVLSIRNPDKHENRRRSQFSIWRPGKVEKPPNNFHM